jgi:hypothetical protein
MSDINLSIEDEVRAAMAEHQEEVPAAETPPVAEPEHDDHVVIETPPDGERDERGRFKAKEKAEEGDLVETPLVETPPAEDPFAQPYDKAPKSVREKWAEIDPEVRKELTLRERDLHKGFTAFDEERQFGRNMRSIVAPYTDFLTKMNARPEQAFEYLMKTDYALRTAAPEQRAAMFVQAARDYGVDLSQLSEQAANPPPAPDPAIAALSQKISYLEGMLNSGNTAARETEQGEVDQSIQAFREDPANIHFEKVAPIMGTLIESGHATGLKDAYDQAVLVHPETRALHLQALSAAEERKRIEAATAKAAQARKASVSVTGASGSTPSPQPESSGSLEDDIRNAIRAAEGRV